MTHDQITELGIYAFGAHWLGLNRVTTNHLAALGLDGMKSRDALQALTLSIAMTAEFGGEWNVQCNHKERSKEWMAEAKASISAARKRASQPRTLLGILNADLETAGESHGVLFIDASGSFYMGAFQQYLKQIDSVYSSGRFDIFLYDYHGVVPYVPGTFRGGSGDGTYKIGHFLDGIFTKPQYAFAFTDGQCPKLPSRPERFKWIIPGRDKLSFLFEGLDVVRIAPP